jgi:hypothetical protein
VLFQIIDQHVTWCARARIFLSPSGNGPRHVHRGAFEPKRVWCRPRRATRNAGEHDRLVALDARPKLIEFGRLFLAMVRNGTVRSVRHRIGGFRRAGDNSLTPGPALFSLLSQTVV